MILDPGTEGEIRVLLSFGLRPHILAYYNRYIEWSKLEKDDKMNVGSDLGKSTKAGTCPSALHKTHGRRSPGSEK